MAENIVIILAELSHALGIPVVTPEYELMLVLLQVGAMTPNELFAMSRLSRSGFFHAMARLKHRGWVEATTGPLDRRCKTYRLCPRTSALLIANLKTLHAAQCAVLDADKAGEVVGNDRFDQLHLRDGTIRLPHLSCEFQIIIYLRFKPGATCQEISGHVTTSQTRFYHGLRRLVDLGLLQATKGGADRRRKCYFLSSWVVPALRDHVGEAMEWVDQTSLRLLPGAVP